MRQGTLRRIAASSHDVLCIALGLLLEHAILQILVFPLLAIRLGSTAFGRMQYLLAVARVISVSLGTSLSLARISAQGAERERGGGYHAVLGITGAVLAPFAFLLAYESGALVQAICYALLFLLMCWRRFSEVFFKLTLRADRAFGFYGVIGLGYLAGLFLARALAIWPLALVVGEATGILYAYLRENVLRRGAWTLCPSFRPVLRDASIFFASEALFSLVLCADRLLPYLFLGGEAVSAYYLATVAGRMMPIVTLPLNWMLTGKVLGLEKTISRKTVWKILGFVLASLCILAVSLAFFSYLIVAALYPAQLALVREYLLVGGFAYALYSASAVLVTLLLRFAHGFARMMVSAAFSLCFLLLGIPALLSQGLRGFACVAVVAGGVRFLVAASLCLTLSGKESSYETRPFESEKQNTR